MIRKLKHPKTNQDMRDYAAFKNVYLYQVAQELGIGDNTLFRALRKPFTATQRDQFKAAVDNVINNNKAR